MKIKLLYIVLLFSGYAINAQDRITGKSFATRSVVLAQNGIVATSHPLASQIGLDILKKGGNAIDAAIAANAALGLMEPTGCGIGGDLFAIVWDGKTKKLYGLNASGRSPKKLTLDYFEKKGMIKIPSHGPLPVSVPGAVDGWFELHEKFGSKPIDELLSPAINMQKRFSSTELIAWYLNRSVPFINQKDFQILLTPILPKTMENYQKKENCIKTLFSRDIQKIANGGRDAFYKGEIAKVIGDFIHQQGGFFH